MQSRKQRKQILKQKQREIHFNMPQIKYRKIMTQDPIRTHGPMRPQSPIERNQITTCSKQQLGKKTFL